MERPRSRTRRPGDAQRRPSQRGRGREATPRSHGCRGALHSLIGSSPRRRLRALALVVPQGWRRGADRSDRLRQRTCGGRERMRAAFGVALRHLPSLAFEAAALELPASTSLPLGLVIHVGGHTLRRHASQGATDARVRSLRSLRIHRRMRRVGGSAGLVERCGRRSQGLRDPARVAGRNHLEMHLLPRSCPTSAVRVLRAAKLRRPMRGAASSSFEGGVVRWRRGVPFPLLHERLRVHRCVLRAEGSVPRGGVCARRVRGRGVRLRVQRAVSAVSSHPIRR
jgi:hypothetical protein